MAPIARIFELAPAVVTHELVRGHKNARSVARLARSDQEAPKAPVDPPRLIERDTESVLAWAREPWACVIFNLHVVHTAEGVARGAAHFRRLIDLAIAHGGSYFLTYHRWATRRQVERCHPRLVEGLRAKRRHDPEERFQSEWYRHYRTMFADVL